MIYKVVIKGRYYGNHTAPGWNDRIASSARHPKQGGRMEKDFLTVCIDAIRTQLRGVKLNIPVELRYAFYEPDKRRDLGNIAYIDKPFCDALQKCGVLENDGQNEIRKLLFELGETDKENPRIEVFISEVSNSDC